MKGRPNDGDAFLHPDSAATWMPTLRALRSAGRGWHRPIVSRGFAPHTRVMTAVFDNLGVHFEYPENWTLDEDPASEDQASVTVNSPGGAFWSLTIHPASAELSEIMQVVLAVLREEYQEIDAEPVEEVVSDQTMLGFDVSFYCLDLTNTALIRSFQTERATYLLLCQAEDCDFDQLQAVFSAITTSLIRSSPL